MWKDDRFTRYSMYHLRKDILSGVIVGIVALPLAMAFAIASGVRPEYGIYTTIVAGFLVALFGGSRYQIAGPTGAFVPILFALVSQYGYENLLIIGFMAGILIALIGILKLGTFIQFIPRPVTVGFTAGIGVLIFMGQLPSFLGLHNLDTAEEEFIYKFKKLLLNITDVNVYSVVTAIVCLSLTLLVTRYFKRVPGALIGLLGSTMVATLFFPEKVATIGSVFGVIPHQLPHLQFPMITLDKISQLFIPACIVAMLGGVESLLSAVVADKMSKSRHHSNRELIGQGIANMVTPLFGGIPATGAIARTATNIRNGATSPVSAMVHSLFVLMVLVMFSSYASHIPLASMAPILMIVAWNMSERKEFAAVLKSKSGDSIVLVATFLLTVIYDLVVGVSVGLGLSFLLFGVRMSRNFSLSSSSEGEVSETHPSPPIYRLEGPLFFGSAQALKEEMELRTDPVLVLSLDKVTYMDTTGELVLFDLIQKWCEEERTLVLTGVQKQPKAIIEKWDSLYRIEDDVFATNMVGLSFLQNKEKEVMAQTPLPV